MLDAVLRPPEPRERPAARWFLIAAAVAFALFLGGVAVAQRPEIRLQPYVVGAALIVAGLPTLDFGLRRWRLLRLIETTHTSTAGALEPGTCELEGTVELGADSLAGPKSGKPCAWYAYRVTRAGGRPGVVVKDERRGVPFYCRDATGRVLVDPHGIAPEAVSRDLVLAEGDLTHEEHRLDPGDRLYVLGVARPQPDGRGLVVSLGDEPVAYLWNLTQHDAALVALRRAAFAVALGAQLAAVGGLAIWIGTTWA